MEIRIVSPWVRTCLKIDWKKKLPLRVRRGHEKYEAMNAVLSLGQSQYYVV